MWHGWVGAGAGACQQAGAAVADLGGHERRDEHAHWTRRAKAHAELGVASAAAQRGTALPRSRRRSVWTAHRYRITTRARMSARANEEQARWWGRPQTSAFMSSCTHSQKNTRRPSAHTCICTHAAASRGSCVHGVANEQSGRTAVPCSRWSLHSIHDLHARESRPGADCVIAR